MEQQTEIALPQSDAADAAVVLEETSVATLVPDTSVAVVDAGSSAEIVPTVEVVGLDTAVQQMQALVPPNSDSSPAVMLMGAVMLALVGTALKVVPGAIKASQEAKLKTLEMEAQKEAKKEQEAAGIMTAFVAADTAIKSLQARVALLDTRLEIASASAATAASELGDMKVRIEKLEKAMKQSAPKPTPAKRSVRKR